MLRDPVGKGIEPGQDLCFEGRPKIGGVVRQRQDAVHLAALLRPLLPVGVVAQHVSPLRDGGAPDGQGPLPPAFRSEALGPRKVEDRGLVGDAQVVWRGDLLGLEARLSRRIVADNGQNCAGLRGQ